MDECARARRVSRSDDSVYLALDLRLQHRMRELWETASTTWPNEAELAAIKQELLCLIHLKINEMRRSLRT